VALARVLARGQVTLPREVRRLAGIKPGDALDLEVVGPGRLRGVVLPQLGPRELRERYPIEGPIDEAVDRASWEGKAAKEALRD
jgi:AbrB family looped-hinge helix DNA binding protein